MAYVVCMANPTDTELRAEVEFVMADYGVAREDAVDIAADVMAIDPRDIWDALARLATL